ncbi:GNAT family N-acetyltransferase [Brachybacterium squillarum]|uniref:GNAT family N-acetyltransferase n=1 Tax=Brachybacterium squillarum TaxID=661979 RepID=UPI00026297E3|nr:GNAT family N-acetyltransferase [Brachybacterium squillarum]
MNLRPATAEDIDWLVELRAVVMCPNLERVGVFDPAEVRQRFRNGYVPDNTRIIVTEDGREIGCIAVRAEPEAYWIEHFYLDPDTQGRGTGTAVLRQVLSEMPEDRPVRLNVLQHSPAGRLYSRHGFVLEDEDAVDRWLVRHPAERPALSS